MTLRRGECRSFLQAQVLCLISTVEYKQTTFDFDTKDVHPVDQMDMHRKTREMIYSTLTSTAMTASKL